MTDQGRTYFEAETKKLAAYAETLTTILAATPSATPT
jgi:hypothetical protein